MEHDALRQRQLPLGAQFSTASPLAEHFGAPRSELTAVGTHNVVFDVGNRSQVELTGGDRLAFLNNFCTNDVGTLGQPLLRAHPLPLPGALPCRARAPPAAS